MRSQKERILAFKRRFHFEKIFCLMLEYYILQISRGAASVRSGLSTFQICQFHYFIVVLRHIVPSFYCSSLYLSPCNASPEFQNKRMIEFSMSLLEMCLTEFKSRGLVWRVISATLKVLGREEQDWVE